MTIEPKGYMPLLQQEIAVRSMLQPQDVYKLLFQAVRGPEHLITSAEEFERRLVAEWNSIHPAGDEPLFEIIRPDASLSRVNLRPYKQMGGRITILSTACLETGRISWGTDQDLQAAWHYFVTCCREEMFPVFDLAAVLNFHAWLEENHFPAVHHSQVYRLHYRPAYRLIAARFELSTAT